MPNLIQELGTAKVRCMNRIYKFDKFIEYGDRDGKRDKFDTACREQANEMNS